MARIKWITAQGIMALALSALTACVTGADRSREDAQELSPKAESRTSARIDNDGVVRDSDSVAVAVDPLTDKLMLEQGFNGAIVSGPDNNAHVVLLFETKEDLEHFRKDMSQRESEFKKVKGLWHFTYKVKGTDKKPASSGLVRIKLDVEKFEEEGNDDAH